MQCGEDIRPKGSMELVCYFLVTELEFLLEVDLKCHKDTADGGELD